MVDEAMVDEAMVDEGMASRSEDTPTIEFCGSMIGVDHEPFTIGRDADLVLDDDNRFLHRRFLSVTSQRGVWLLTNIGDHLTATVSDPDRRLEAWLAPGAILPLTIPEAVVGFRAGPTTYEFTVRLAGSPFAGGRVGHDGSGDATIGRVTMTPDQLRLVLALAEPTLRGGHRAATVMPSSSDAARRLGWTITKFNRKLDNVCHKLSAQGVRGLHGGLGRLASQRRARLVEYALAVRMVTAADVDLLDAGDRAA